MDVVDGGTTPPQQPSSPFDENVGLPDHHTEPLKHLDLDKAVAVLETPSGSVVDEDEVVDVRQHTLRP
jgi:hypothetical protein